MRSIKLGVASRARGAASALASRGSRMKKEIVKAPVAVATIAKSLLYRARKEGNNA